jgi:hypothetical protein
VGEDDAVLRLQGLAVNHDLLGHRPSVVLGGPPEREDLLDGVVNQENDRPRQVLQASIGADGGELLTGGDTIPGGMLEQWIEARRGRHRGRLIAGDSQLRERDQQLVVVQGLALELVQCPVVWVHACKGFPL